MPQPKRELTRTERLDWLRLIRTENVGPITFRALLTRFGSAAAALDALPELARRGGRTRPLKPPSRAVAERELAAHEAAEVRLIGLIEPAYPALLAALDDAPPLLAVGGNGHLLARPAIGVVGARNASLNGKRLAGMLARELAAADYVVVSGLARGIDAAAHDGALDGGTVAAIAGGLDVVYPPENADLWREIGARGALVGESPPGTQPTARHFPRRNRLIAGLALGVVVVEAAPRSGSLITARLAAEAGREVFAVPGSPLDPRAQGCNRLIRDGATLVESAADVIEGIARMARPLLEEMSARLFAPAGGRGDGFGGTPTTPPVDTAALESARRAVLENLSPTPTAVDELIRGCQLSPTLVLTVILELELAGRVERQPGNRVSLI
jgi:DNA processing protein